MKYGTLKLYGAATFVLLAAVATANEPESKQTLQEIRQAVEQEQAILMDVREPRETQEGFVRDAVRMPISELQQAESQNELQAKLAELDLPKDRTIYTYCRSGHRAGIVAQMLDEAGYRAQRLTAGYERLVESGFPESKPETDE